MTALVRLRWREDASGYLAPYAGQWASPSAMTRREAEDLARAMPNGAQLEIVEQTEPTYGMCTACGAVEVALNKAIGTRDLSHIGESANYPTGYGCEVCS